jgi:hypothetical protein
MRKLTIRSTKDVLVWKYNKDFRTSHYKQYEDLPVFALLSVGELGPWPLLRKVPWEPDEFQLHRLLGELAVYQVHTILEMYVTPDERNASQYSLQVNKIVPALDDRKRKLNFRRKKG